MPTSALPLPKWIVQTAQKNEDPIAVPSPKEPRPGHKGDWRLFLKNLVLVPVFPLLGFYGLDQTGVSNFLVSHGLMAREILGEGFGHVGLCFSLHYVMNAARYFYRACRFSMPF